MTTCTTINFLNSLILSPESRATPRLEPSHVQFLPKKSYQIFGNRESWRNVHVFHKRSEHFSSDAQLRWDCQKSCFWHVFNHFVFVSKSFFYICGSLREKCHDQSVKTETIEKSWSHDEISRLLGPTARIPPRDSTARQPVHRKALCFAAFYGLRRRGVDYYVFVSRIVQVIFIN